MWCFINKCYFVETQTKWLIKAKNKIHFITVIAAVCFPLNHHHISVKNQSIKIIQNTNIGLSVFMFLFFHAKKTNSLNINNIQTTSEKSTFFWQKQAKEDRNRIERFFLFDSNDIFMLLDFCIFLNNNEKFIFRLLNVLSLCVCSINKFHCMFSFSIFFLQVNFIYITCLCFTVFHSVCLCFCCLIIIIIKIFIWDLKWILVCVCIWMFIKLYLHARHITFCFSTFSNGEIFNFGSQKSRTKYPK